jgi:glycosyltransferase involved in cell wall biosynthesis
MRADPPLISAIIPTYRRPHLLRRAIRSVLNQTYPHLRVCVYDNASADETAATVAEIAREDERVAYYCHPENIGAAPNFAYAMGHVETSYFSMLSDDDYYFPEFYETAMQGFARHPQAIASAGATVAITDGGHIYASSLTDGYFTPPDGFLVWANGNGPMVTSMVFRREILAQVGLIDQTILHADIDYLWRMASQYPFIASKQPSLVYTMHTEQSTRRTPMETWLESYLVIAERVRNTPGVTAHVARETERYLETLFSRPIFFPGLMTIADGEYDRARSAAAMLRTHFHRRGEAALLDALAGICARIPPVHWLARGLLRTAQRANMRYTTARRDRMYAAVRGVTNELTRNLTAPSVVG